MTPGQEIADLQRRVADLERLTAPMIPLGPRPYDADYGSMIRVDLFRHINSISLNNRHAPIVTHAG